MKIRAPSGNDFQKTYLENIESGDIMESLPEMVLYSCADYGLPIKCIGTGVKIAIIDSGVPQHNDIEIRGSCESFCNNNIYDKIGHSTLISGIINAKNKSKFIGIAPGATLYYAKVVDSKGIIKYNSIISSILWSIIKGVDIILLSLGSQYNFQLLHDVIIKAYNSGICIVSAAGNNLKNEINYPSRYPEVFSVGDTTNNKTIFNLPLTNMYSTYLDNKYVKASGTSLSAAVVAGLTACIIENKKYINKKEVPLNLKIELNKILRQQ